MTITASDVKTLLTFEETISTLNAAEPDGSLMFNTGPDCPVNIELPQGWNALVAEKDGTDILPGVSIGVSQGATYEMTKDALLDFTSTLSIQREYMMRTPGSLMAPHVKYWLTQGDRDYRFLVKNGVAVAMARKPSVVPFSNADLLLRIAERMEAKHLIEDPSDLYVDFKGHHDLKYTAVRLIAPTPVKAINSQRSKSGKVDEWSIGVQVHNSLTGFFPTQVSGYMFAWYCKNGATATHLDISKYNRRIHGQDWETVVEWLDPTVDTLLDELPYEIDAVEKLTQIDLADEMSSTLRDVFERLKVPMAARGPILDNVMDSSDSSAYGLMQAITEAANDTELNDEVKTRILYVGGDMPALLGDRCDTCHRLPV